ncbi:MAG: nucleotide exchange factor GrpE [Anaerolineales bacterium]|jgi:molecular chaperone GrpE
MKSKNKKEEIPEIKMEQNDSELNQEDILEELVLDPDLEDELEEHSLEEQVAALQVSLDEIKIKAEEYLDGWQRARAEFANYKKRILRDHTEIHQSARGEVIKLYLDIADDLDRALQEKPADGEGETWADGIEIIFQKLYTRLELEGIKPMNPLGEEFDPNIHEALMKEESDEYESGQIIEVMQEGYWIGDKVLRPALVRVAA